LAATADPKSGVFYSRTKGELEQALRRMQFPSLTLVQPGLLGGKRFTQSKCRLLTSSKSCSETANG
jgi:uncharacterized protein YbjT (DUF2867 family)